MNQFCLEFKFYVLFPSEIRTFRPITKVTLGHVICNEKQCGENGSRKVQEAIYGGVKMREKSQHPA